MRGVIENTARKQQIIDFRHLKYGNITPTDLDAYIEYKDKAKIWIEFKYRNAEPPYGQRLAMQRDVKDAEKIGKEAIAIIAEHDVHDTAHSVMADECQVREICYKQCFTWRPPKYPCTVKQMVDKFIEYADRDANI